MSLWQYLKDARSIPVTGEETNGLEPIPSSASFLTQNENLFFITSPSSEPVPLGTHIKYLVDNQ